MSKKSKVQVSKPVSAVSGGSKSTVNTSKSNVDFYLIALGIVIFSVLLLRMRLVDIPLERDEGEYAYLGKLLLEGVPPYKEAYNMKLPGTYVMYAFVMGIFGKSIEGVHLGLMIMNIGTILLLFFAFRKLFNAAIALITVSIFGLMSFSPNLLGFAAHATHFVTFFAAMALFFFSRYRENKSILFALFTGFSFGMAFLMKQQAVFLLVFGGIVILSTWLLTKPTSPVKAIIHAGIYSVGGVLPYILTVLILMAAGVFDKFWFWTYEYASKYASGVSFEDGKMLFGMSFKPMWEEFRLYWLLFFAGLVLVFFTKFSLQQKLLAVGFALFAFLTVVPGFYFRQHYFIPFLPAVGLLAAITLNYLETLVVEKANIKAFKYVPFIFVVIISFVVVNSTKAYYLKAKPSQLSRMIYGTNPFIESVEIAKFIKENSQKEDKIAVLGSEPQIFLYADRNSGSGYIYTYGLMEDHPFNKKMQEEMITEIENSKPKFLVFCRINTSWLARPNSPTIIFDWFNKYSQENYELVGVADIVAQNQTNYMWNDDAKRYQPQGQEYVLIFKRK